MDTRKVFISYRRVPCVEFARTIHYALSKFGIDSFFDYTSCRDGHFNENIFKAIDECQYVFLVIMDGALDKMWEDPDDWVRKEIEYALDRGKIIVPVVKNGNLREWPDRLPKKLEHLSTLQISKIDDEELFEISLKEVLLSRTSLLVMNDTAADNIIPGKIFLSKFVSLGFQLTGFIVRYLRAQCDASGLDSLRHAIKGATIPFPDVDRLSSDTMYKYIDECEHAVADVFGEQARCAVDFGVIFHLSDIAKRSIYLGQDFVNMYDEPLAASGKRLHLDEDLLKKIIAANGENMMDYYQQVKFFVDKF